MIWSRLDYVSFNTCAWLTAHALFALFQLLYFFALQYTYILSKHSSDPSKAGKLLPMSEDAKKQVQPVACAVQGLMFVRSAASGAPGSSGISLGQERWQGRQAGRKAKEERRNQGGGGERGGKWQRRWHAGRRAAEAHTGRGSRRSLR